MLISLVFLLAGAFTPIARAASATVFPVGLGPEANLRGQIVGSGGEVGTTYVLSGETSGLPFTLTLAQDSNMIAEHIAIPTLSVDLVIGCVVSGGSAICENVVGSGASSATSPLTTIPFQPFVVAVSTSGVHARPTSASSTPTQVSASATSSAPSSSLALSSTATVVSPSADSSPVGTQPASSDALRSVVANVGALALPLAMALWILV